MSNNLYAMLPSTERLIQVMQQHFYDTPNLLLKTKINEYLENLRQQIKKGNISKIDLEEKTLIKNLLSFLNFELKPHFREVINGTGVVVHTNLGRSLLSKKALNAVCQACSHYSNLEFNLNTGKRGSRYSHVEEILCLLTGAESALVVNNNAAAVLIMLDTLAKEKEVIVSRGELVEIGGSFRIPDVMQKSGAILKEVGTTNRTHLKDYEQAINENTACIVKVHTSNYRIIGFHKSVSLEELVKLGAKYHLPIIEDMGSGNFISFSKYGFSQLNEPTVQESIKVGLDLVSFSGDKLLGGPQAGIIVGKKDIVDKIKQNPLNRALRIDKMTLSALEATLRLYLDEATALKEIPTLNLIFTPLITLKNRARRLKNLLSKIPELEVKTVKSTSRVGGGSLPEKDISTYVVQIKMKNLSAEKLRQKLLKTTPPLIGRIEDDIFCLDVRTILPKEINLIYQIFSQQIGSSNA
ncbi:L-seryl-tRNA(Sec) selenium transferase [Desulfonauticus submarinus]